MAGFFTLLLLIALGLFLGSLVVPAKVAKLVDKKDKYSLTRRSLGTSFGLLVVVLIILVGVTAPPPTKPTPINLSPAKTKTSTPDVTTKIVTETKSVPFSSTTVQDSHLAQGTSSVTTKGVDGVETLTYKETFTNGKQTAKQLVSDVVTTQPVTQVTTVGTYVAPAPPAPSNTSASTTCYPLTNGGNCYEPGEYCRNSDHGASGVAGNGEAITCEYNNGWRWEPS